MAAMVPARWLPAAVYIAVPSILILTALRSGEFLMGVDVIGGSYYLRGEIGKALASGRLPVWDPHVMAGFPLFASGWSAVLYPPTWLSVVLSPGAFWTATALLHMILAGVFAHRWLERGMGLGPWAALAGGVGFMMSGYFVTHLHAGHMNIVWSFPWIPALLWRLERTFAGPTLKRGVLLAVVLAMLCLAGVPQYVYFAAWLAGARGVHYVLSEREARKQRLAVAGRAAGWLVLGLLLCAPQLLPMLELISQGQRVTVNNYDFVTSYSPSPAILASLVAPTFFGDGREAPFRAEGFSLESTGFLGVAGLALAALGATGTRRQRCFWLAIAVVALVVSMGRHTPVFRLFFHLVPGVNLFRVPPRYLLLFTVAVVALAAMGFDRLRTGDERLRRDLAWVAGIAGALLVGSGALLLSIGSHSLVWAMVCLAAVVAILLPRRGPASAVALGVLLVGELWVFDARYFVGHPEKDMEWPPEFVANVRNHPKFPFRIATTTSEQTPAIGKCQLAGIDHLGGYEPMMLRRYAEFANVARGKPASDLVVAMVLARPNPLFDLLGARYWIVPGPKQEPPGWKAVGELPSGIVYENPNALPRAFLVGRSVNYYWEEERLKFMTSPEFDARRMVVTEHPSGGGGGYDGDVGTVQLLAREPGLYRFATRSLAETFLVLTETYYPGWSVEIDGKPAHLFRANHLVQGVRVPGGPHEVTFSYRSQYLSLGFAIAATAALVPLVLAARRRRTG